MEILSQYWTRISVAGFLCIALISFAGCSGPEEPVGTLSGLVYSGNNPISQCRVRIFHKETYKSKMVTVGEDGRYEFTDIPIGEYSMAVLTEAWYEASEPPPDNRIPQKYRDLKTSGLAALVNEGSNEFDLKMVKK